MGDTDRQPVLAALDTLDSLQKELQGALDGGVIAAHYVEEKLELFRRHLRLIFREGPVVGVRD